LREVREEDVSDAGAKAERAGVFNDEEMKRSHFVFLPFAAVYLAWACFELPRVRYQINPDGVSYLAIAERYLTGNIGAALNAYWGPLFSWLLTPLLALGIEPLLACKVLTFAAGMATLFGGWILSGRYTRVLVIRAVISVALVPMILVWAASLVTPDIFMVCFLTYYAYFISDATMSRRSMFLAALFGALAYLAKSYAFVFIPIHFAAVAVGRWICARAQSRRKEVWQRAVLGLAAFLALTLPWVAAISLKSGRPTFGTAGAYNLAVAGLTSGPEGSQTHSVDAPGLRAPPDEGAFSVWEDPSFGSLHWPSPASFGRLVVLMKANVPVVLKYLQEVSPIVLLIVAASILFSLRWRTSPESRLVAGTFASGALYTLGYVFIWVEPRYLWILEILLLMMAGVLVDWLRRWQTLSALTTCLIAVLVAGSFLLRPLAQLPRLAYAGRVTTEMAQSLAHDGVDLRNRRLASDIYWYHTLHVGYFLRARYFGVVPPDDPETARRELDEFKIDTFFVWGDRAAAKQYLSGFREVPVTASNVPFAVFQR
jgi:Dolichyl-phosphate-mannose-protein mannosyltransferase